MVLSLRHKFGLLLLLLLAVTLSGVFWLAQHRLSGIFSQTIEQELRNNLLYFKQLWLNTEHSLDDSLQALQQHAEFQRALTAPTPLPLTDSLLATLAPKDCLLFVDDGQGKLLAANQAARQAPWLLNNLPKLTDGAQTLSDLNHGLLQIKLHSLPKYRLWAVRIWQANDLTGWAVSHATSLLVLQNRQIVLHSAFDTASAETPAIHAQLLRYLADPATLFQTYADIQPLTLDGERFITLAAPSQQPTIPDLFLLQSLDKRLLFTHRLAIYLALIGGASTLLGLLLASPLFRQISSGLVLLRSAVEQIEQENYQFQFKPSRYRELARTADTLNRLMQHLEEQEKLQKAMEQLVSKDLALQLLQQPELAAPRHAQGVVLYANLRQFSTLYDQFAAPDLLDFLNNYLTRMSFCITAQGGLLDKYLGDVLIALFELHRPQTGGIQASLRSAQDMLDALTLFNLEIANPLGQDMRLGIGIAAGDLVTGRLGAQGRQTYSVLGKPLKRASALEQLARVYGVAVLLDESSYQALQAEASSGPLLRACRLLDEVPLSADSAPIKIYELLARRHLNPQFEPLLQRFQEARAYLAQHQTQLATDCLQRLHEEWPEDGPTRFLLARCRHDVLPNHTAKLPVFQE